MSGRRAAGWLAAAGLAVAVAVGLGVARSTEHAPAASPAAPPIADRRAADVRQILILDAALVRADRDLSALEAAAPRDEAAIAAQREARAAVAQTLAMTRRRLAQRDAANAGAKAGDQ